MGVRFQGPVTWPQICLAGQVEMYCNVNVNTSEQRHLTMAFSKSGLEPILVKRNWPRMYQTGRYTSFSSGLHAQIWVYQTVLEKLDIKVFNEKSMLRTC